MPTPWNTGRAYATSLAYPAPKPNAPQLPSRPLFFSGVRCATSGRSSSACSGSLTPTAMATTMPAAAATRARRAAAALRASAAAASDRTPQSPEAAARAPSPTHSHPGTRRPPLQQQQQLWHCCHHRQDYCRRRRRIRRRRHHHHHHHHHHLPFPLTPAISPLPVPDLPIIPARRLQKPRRIRPRRPHTLPTRRILPNPLQQRAHRTHNPLACPVWPPR